MSAGYDGSIRIDTQINTSGMNAGIKNITGKFAGIIGAVKAMGIAVAGLVNMLTTGGILLLLAAIGHVFIGIAASIRSAFSMAKGQTFETIKRIKDSFEELKTAFALAFLPLIEAAMPVIQTVITWLTVLLNKIAMVTAAFFGQKEVLQVLVGSAAKLAKNMAKTGEAAKGALAAFDQLNILNVAKKPEEAPADTAATAMTQMVPISDSIAEKVAKIKQTFSDLENTVRKNWTNVTEWLGEIWHKVWGSISEWGKNTWDEISKKWNDLSTWFKEKIITPLRENFANAWGFISILANDAWVTIKFYWGKAVDWYRENILDPLKARFSEAWENIKTTVTGAWVGISEWLNTNIPDPLKKAFGTALDWIKEKFESIFGGIKGIVKGTINAIIDLLNGMLGASVGTLNNLIGGANTFGKGIPGWQVIPSLAAPQIPHLATGTVIPPNSQFMAVLGDQKSGVNIETPVSLMRDTFAEVLGHALAAQKINITFAGPGSELVRMLKPMIDQENARIGNSAIKGTAIV